MCGADVDNQQALDAQDSPLAALRAVAAVERITRHVGWQVAFDVDPDDVPWDQMGRALGLSADQLQTRLMSYRPETLRYWRASERRYVGSPESRPGRLQ